MQQLFLRIIKLIYCIAMFLLGTLFVQPRSIFAMFNEFCGYVDFLSQCITWVLTL